MLEYKITSDRERTVDGLAVFAKGETQTFTPTEIDNAMRIRGVPLVHSLPEGMTLEIDAPEEEEV